MTTAVGTNGATTLSPMNFSNSDPNPNPNFAAQSSDYFHPVACRPAGETAHRCEQSVSSLF